MAKRIAANELNDRNWDQEEEEEEAGKFVAANTDTLKKRTIIKAKRRATDTTSAGSGLFSSFAGFGSAAASGNSKTVGFAAPTSKPFLFGSGSTSTSTGTTSDSSSTDSKSAEMQSTISAVSFNTGSSSNNGFKSSTTASTPTTTTDKSSDDKDSEFMCNLKKLNESVLKWITQHVAENPYCILTPIFKDYDEHLKKIRKSESSEQSTTGSNTHKNGSSISTPSATDPAATTTTPSVASIFSSPTTTSSSSLDAAAPTTTLSSNPWPISNSIFSSNTSKTTLATTPASSLFSGGTSGFSFKPSDTKSAFSFAASVAKTDSSESTAAKEEEYEPPVVETKEIKEEGAVYTKRCKLYYEKDKNWIDKGVGNLHVKPLENKAQLIIRADTNLGNILLNIMLLPSMNLKRQGKNNVSLACIPNPPFFKDADSKPVPMLLRVKTGEEADELLEELNKHKSGTASGEADDE